MEFREHLFHSGEPPITREYTFPLAPQDAQPDDKARIEKFVEEYGESSTAVDTTLMNRFDSISCDEVDEFLEVLGDFRPFSVAILEDRTWIALADPVDPMSAAPFMISADPIPVESEMVSPFPLERFPHIIEFLTQFSGLTRYFPPFAGVYQVADIVPAHMHEETGLWLGIGDWAGSLPVYSVGNGDSILMNEVGRAGYWSHEYGQPTGDLRNHYDSIGFKPVEMLPDDPIKAIVKELRRWDELNKYTG